MCGIFGIVSRNVNVTPVILKGLKKLEYRGYDSWGIAIKKNSRIVIEKHVGKIGQAKSKLPASRIGLGHTRWATHGGVTIANAHPHLDCSQQLCLVHNGIVENFRELKQGLVKNHSFQSETDTEVALHLIEEEGKTHSSLEAVSSAFRQIHGLNALIILNAQADELIAVKNGSPLIIGLGKTANYISSDVWALLDHTQRLIFLEDNQLVRLTKDKVSLFDSRSRKKLKPIITQLNWKKEQSRLGKFHHYMEKEIFDQPQVLLNLSRLEKTQLQPIVSTIRRARKTYVLGCGTASHAAMFAEYLFNLAGLDIEAIVGSEFSKNQALLSPDKAFILLSQSGETIDVIEAVRLAKKKRLKIIGITNVLGSSLYRQSDIRLLLNAGQEVAVASTKAFTAKLAILIQLLYQSQGHLAEGQTLIRRASRALVPICQGKTRQQIKNLAVRIKDQEHMFVIGRLLSYPIALEAALKIKEVSYVHAEGFAGGELKHGPIALIERGMPCLVIAPQDSTLADTLSSAHEMKARGGLIIGLSPQNQSIFDVYVPVPDLKQASAIVNTVVAQLLAYDLAVCRGLNPDKPRNLAKSVTVK